MNPVRSLAEAPAAPSSSLATPTSPPPGPAPAPAPALAPAPASVSLPPPSSSPGSPLLTTTPAQSLAALATQQQQQQQQQQAPPPPRPPPPPPPSHLQKTPTGPLPRPDELRLSRQLTPTPSNTSPSSHFFLHHQHSLSNPPPRKDTNSSISTQGSAESNNTSYSADTSPTLHQSIFALKDGSDVSNSRRTSRRRTGPLSQQSRERAALIRKLGACHDCRRRRVACHPSHHNMTWEDVVNKFHRSHSPTIQDIAPSLAAAARPMSPILAGLSTAQSLYVHDTQEMDIDSNLPSQNQPSRLSLSEARQRTPLPSGPRLEKSLSLPGIETLKNELQASASRMLTTTSRSRYATVQALLLFWQDDDDVGLVHNAVRELADILDKLYHYSCQIQTIPSSTDGTRSSWRWLSRQLNDFAEDRDQRDVLKVVYYIGHTYLDGNREMVLASSRDPQKASNIRWNGIQQILEEACADTLIIMDAAYYPSSRMARQRGVLELIAASTSDQNYLALDRCSFTLALSDILRTRASRANPLSAAELHSILFSNYGKMVQDRNPEREVVSSFPAPLHTMMSGNSRLPSIFLSPVLPHSPPRASLHDSYPLLHMSIRLNDDNVDLDSWNEWLRLMPDGIRDVKVEGPFRATPR